MNQHFIKKQWFLLGAHNLVETKGEQKDEAKRAITIFIPHPILIFFWCAVEKFTKVRPKLIAVWFD
jgi:hypothetical protein